MEATLKTRIFSYWFDIRQPAAAAQYKALKTKLKAQGLKCFETHGGGSHFSASWEKGTDIELETAHLFNNQWNTAPINGEGKGLRVFDWAQDYNSPIGAPTGIKRGHYIEQTPEMAEARRNTNACGYCGKQEPAQKGNVFCPHCLDSEYLKDTELHLLRMRSVANTGNRAPLTEAEAAHLLPLYREAQLHGNTERGKKRIAEKRARIEREYQTATKNAKTEHDGTLWLMDHGINTENCIWYDHKATFSFGWRTPIGETIRPALLEALKEFPYPYEIK